ncbi:siderophore-iron reductase FhuF [Rhizobium paknamense]|uniref:Ferric iron reductase protein FhuF n=1 Tax=Rhizobium paknamense TaxID=1206817 RepID=A0ABU0IFP6_9HYPH|nr:siderophore-iron reductase FhuF [Rhizobium paknamense]MDQ0457082.1 ferric iron reductase protein FhuF [Rhizobium paknamense]
MNEPAFADLGALIARETQNRYPYAGSQFLLQRPQDLDVLPCASLTDPAVLQGLMQRFAATFPPGTDRRALISYWSLFYVSGLVIAPALCWLELRRILPLALTELSLLIDPETGLPRGFLLPHAGHVEPQADMHAAMQTALGDHLDLLIPVIARESGLSPKVLWNNAAAYLTWMIHEIGRQGASTLDAEGMAAMITPSHFPDGRKNPFHKAIRIDHDADGAYLGHRRICCLRYAVPGVGGCGAICPVPEGRCSPRG